MLNEFGNSVESLYFVSYSGVSYCLMAYSFEDAMRQIRQTKFIEYVMGWLDVVDLINDNLSHVKQK